MNNEICATEDEMSYYADKNQEVDAQITLRRDAQAKVFTFVNKRLEDNYAVIMNLEKMIQDAEANGEASRKAFLAAEAEAAASCAAELLRYQQEVDSCKTEMKALRDFAQGRDALKADLAALEAARALYERDFEEAHREYAVACEHDRQSLRREAAKAAAAARKVAISKATKSLDAATRRRVDEHRRITSELDVQAREITRLQKAGAAKRATIAQLHRELATIKSNHHSVARQVSIARRTKSDLEDTLKHESSCVDDTFTEIRTVDEMSQSDGVKSENEVPQLLAQRVWPSQSPLKAKLLKAKRARSAELDAMQQLQATFTQRMHAMRGPEVLSMFAAASDIFPAAGIEHWSAVAYAAQAHIDGFLARVFADLHTAHYAYELPSDSHVHSSWPGQNETELRTQLSALASPDASVFQSVQSAGAFSSLADETTLDAGAKTVGDASTIQLPRVASKPSLESTHLSSNRPERTMTKSCP